MPSTVRLLRRYTDLPALLAILKNRRLTLLPPSSWDDRNDRLMMETFRRAKGLKTLLALCFSQANETYHHWRVFSQGSSGVCIEFYRDALLARIRTPGLRFGEVTYLSLTELRGSRIALEVLPFAKRAAFSDEKEFRVIFLSKTLAEESRSLPIGLDCIYRVAINPWLPQALFDASREIIESIEGCEKLRIYQSKLIDSPTWRSYAKQYK